jgi:hypothetical protein
MDGRRIVVLVIGNILHIGGENRPSLCTKIPHLPKQTICCTALFVREQRWSGFVDANNNPCQYLSHNNNPYAFFA